MNFDISLIEASGGLNKDNFLVPAQQIIPTVIARFNKWLEIYARKISWDSLFGNSERVEKYGAGVNDELFNVKFEHLPLEMQLGIILAYLRSEKAIIKVGKDTDLTVTSIFINAIIEGLQDLEERL